MLRLSLLAVMVFCLTVSEPAHAGQPTVSNLVAQQQGGTEIVQITYNLAESGGLPCWIWVQVDRDNLGSWIVPVHALTGDVGAGILPGNGKTIHWNAGLDYDHQYIPITKVKVIAHSLLDGVPQDMVLVPAGTFTMGSSTVGGDAIPEHGIYLNEYWIDKYEVTNREYKVFCDATSREYPPDPSFAGMTNYFSNYPSYPVVNVYWADALAYAQWAGKRLPTEAEWERAAKGDTNNHIYPWGDNFNATIGGTIYHANTDQPGDSWPFTSPVGVFPTGVSPMGCYDMAGNVWEWTADYYSPSYYGSSPPNNPQGPETGTARVRRGGYAGSDHSFTRCSARNNFPPSSRSIYMGFRCARTP